MKTRGEAALKAETVDDDAYTTENVCGQLAGHAGASRGFR